MATTSARKPYRNRLLASLPADLIEQLARHLTPVDLPVNRTLHEAGGRVDTVYFLEDGMCSMVVTMTSGATVEVGRIGRDGFVGAAAILGGSHTPSRCFMNARSCSSRAAGGSAILPRNMLATPQKVQR